jgi:hypothetical protein
MRKSHLAARLGLWVIAGALVLVGCRNREDPPTNGSIQLFFKIDTKGLSKAGLGNLKGVELKTLKLTAKLHSPEFSGPEYVLHADPDGLIFPAEDRLTTGPLYEVPPGYVTQVRVYPSEINLLFTDGSSAPVRLPSGEQTGWKIVVDEEEYPQGYEVKSRQTTGVLVFLTLGEIFHGNAQGWQARPTLESEQYDIAELAGYDPDKIVAIFRPGTSPSRIEEIISEGGFTVDFSYPSRRTRLYKLDLPPNMALRDAHSYLREHSEVVSAAPSVIIEDRILVPTEGTPPELAVLGAETGWENVDNLIDGVGSPRVVLAEVSTSGFNIEHPDLWPNIWLNEQELLAVCGTLDTCDVNDDGVITLRDFNDPAFPAALLPPDANGDGDITCADLLDNGSPFVNMVDDPPGTGNGFIDDLCGWNFRAGSRFVLGTPSDHDTGVAGIMAAAGNEAGDGVGVCWRCRMMAVVAGARIPTGAGQAQGATAEVLSAFAYARDNGAHVANFSAGIDLVPDNSGACPNRARPVDRKAYETVVQEMNAALTAVLADVDGPTTLFTLAGGECGPGIDDGQNDYYDWPPEGFASNTTTQSLSLVVAATANTATAVGGLAGYSNFGTVFEIAAPGDWSNMLSANGGTNYSAQGTSFAAPTVAGIAGLIASGDLPTYSTPNATLLKTEVLDEHSVVQPDLSQISGSRRITMNNLP